MPHLILDDVCVDFPVYDGSQRSLRRSFVKASVGGTIFRRDQRHMAVRALDGVSIELHDGDRVGLIGRNGAGKSTMLRVLAGLFLPTRGRISIKGRVSPLLNLGSIIDPEMTGYENIDHASVLLEIPSKRRRNLVPEVEELTELGGFLELPVKTYSSGMQLRLAFALITAQEPEILLVDELLGVGDSGFLKKAAARMKDFREQTSIMVLASHSDTQILRMCNKAAWMENGRIVQFGPTDEVMAAYQASCGN